MYAIYEQWEDTTIFREGYWLTVEEAMEVLSHWPDGDKYSVRHTVILVDDVKVIDGKIMRDETLDFIDAYYVGARYLSTGLYTTIGWYDTLEMAKRKREKCRGDREFYDWVIELNRLHPAEYNLHVSDVITGEEEEEDDLDGF